MMLARTSLALLTTVTSAALASPWGQVAPPPSAAAASAAAVETRLAAIEARLAGVAGHESTKASIRYPFDLVRLAALGRRPLPGRVDHFDLERQIARSEELLRSLEAGQDPLWRAKGDHARNYYFAAADEIMPYRIYVPTTWNGKSALPLVLMLHGGGATENTSMDNDGGALPALAERRGYIVVCPLGYRPTGAFGNRSSAFGRPPPVAPTPMATFASRERESTLSEQDAMQVLDLVIAEYGVDPRRIYLAGHSMGSGGAWHLAAKYPERWTGVAPMSGPFADEKTYPFDRLRGLPILMTEGTGSTGSLEASRALQRYLTTHKFDLKYIEVNASHLGMVPLVLPKLFEFFDQHRSRATAH